jgi:hypothetical protein
MQLGVEMSEQLEMMSHFKTKQRLKHIHRVAKMCRRYNITISQFHSSSREYRIVDARRELCEEMLAEGHSFFEIAIAVQRDVRSIHQLLYRKRKREPKPDAKHHEVNKDPALRDDSKRVEKLMMEAGSKELCRAIFSTGRIYRPLSEDEVAAAMLWATSGNCNVDRTSGWLK